MARSSTKGQQQTSGSTGSTASTASTGTTGATGGSTGSTGATGSTASTGTTGTQSTGSTATTGGAPSGGAPWDGLMRIERAEEWQNQPTYWNVSGATQTNSQHVARMIVQAGAPPPPPTGSTLVYYQGNWVSCPWIMDNYGYSIGVVSPGEEGIPLSGANPNNYSGPGGSGTPEAATIPTSATATSPGVTTGVTAYGEVPVQIASAGAIGNGMSMQITVGCHVAAHYVDPNTGNHVLVPYSSEQTYSINLTKLSLNGSSIDTRKVFGVPNLAGELPADPNAPSRSVNFTQWVFRGGTFVGYMPYTAGPDESGLARTEMWGPGPGAGTCLAATAVMLDMGVSSAVSGAESVGVFIPDSTDPNLNSGPSGLTWSQAWNINPQPSPSSPVDYAQTPVSTLALTGSNTNDYLNWIIADTSSGGWIIPSSVFSELCFALTNETQGPSWHYFGGAPFSLVSWFFPGTDSQPRIWWVGQTGTSSWTTNY